MDTHNATLDAAADALAEKTLHELGETPLDEPDDYTEQCDYAGCYPWLGEVLCAQPHASPVAPALHDDGWHEGRCWD